MLKERIENLKSLVKSMEMPESDLDFDYMLYCVGREIKLIRSDAKKELGINVKDVKMRLDKIGKLELTLDLHDKD